MELLIRSKVPGGESLFLLSFWRSVHSPAVPVFSRTAVYFKRLWRPAGDFKRASLYSDMSYILKNDGYCVTCDSKTTFSSEKEWLRDYYVCVKCGSIPRERALMFCIERYFPNWKELSILESSPAPRGASVKLKKYCRNYIAAHYFPDFPTGEIHHSGFRNENLERLTFANETFDLFITQDVVEHIFDPIKAFSEVGRVLKVGGAHIFSVPLVNKERPSEVLARREGNGNIIYLQEPEYHGNPISEKGSLVTIHWGYDICDFILRHSGLFTTINYIDNLSLGIRAEYIEILVSKKLKRSREKGLLKKFLMKNILKS